MKEIYRKSGRSVRWENGTIVHVTETGVAIEDEELFECHPISNGATEVAAFEVDPQVEQVAARVATAVASLRNVRIERLIVFHGEAEHTFREKAWRDESRRVHLALTNGRNRALIDLGDFDLEPIVPVAEALERAEAHDRALPPRLRLAPNVAAAMLRSLVGFAPSNVRLTQRAGGIDGKGLPIEAADEHWPNWYRPSYRVRPTRAPFNLTAVCESTEIDPSLPHAVALLEPPDGVASRVLLVDGSRVYPSRLRVTRVAAVGTATTWYPYGPGVCGAEIVV